MKNPHKHNAYEGLNIFIYYRIERPEDWISFAKPLTVSTDNSLISRPKFVFTFFTTSAGHVIISAPISSA